MTDQSHHEHHRNEISDDTDDVFRALADPSRRALLDALRADDGQTLADLCTVLPDMTRFGVMKHLGVLEAAHLVVVERDGRFKRHHLNPVPIRRIHDRWINRFTAAASDELLDLAADIESA